MSRLLRWIAPLLALLPLAASAVPPRRPAAPVMRDWSQVATRTAQGDFVLGNPAAKVKLVEFLSFTCPHCAVFSGEMGHALVDRYIRPGTVSYEVRIALRDPFDMAAALLARCAGPERFFAVTPALFASQNDWLGKGSAWAQTNPKLDGMPEAQAMQAIAAGAGLDAWFAAHGLPRPLAAACLADIAEQHKLADAAQKIWQPGFSGTPAFLVNGVQAADVHDWPALDAKLAAALK